MTSLETTREDLYGGNVHCPGCNRVLDPKMCVGITNSSTEKGRHETRLLECRPCGLHTAVRYPVAEAPAA